MRISEALSLPSDAAPRGTRMLLVRGKGDKQRLVPLHSRAIEAIAQWQKLASAYSGGKPTQWLFHGHRQLNELQAKRLTGTADQKPTATPVTSDQAVKARARDSR